MKDGMDFYKRVALVMEHIPQGKVASYGQIALLCRKPGNARQVGYGLRSGKTGDVPAFRVVNGQGFLSGAGSFETFDLQKMLLEKEGVKVTRTDRGWRVDMKRFGWKNTLADAEELQGEFVRMGI